MKITEYESEPIPGLPEQLPQGEKILWQGAPKWQSFAKHVFHINLHTFIQTHHGHQH